MRPSRFFPLTLVACLSMPFVIFAQPLYTVHDLGIGQPSGINSSGQVIGASGSRGFRTAPNSAINPATDDIGTLCQGNCAFVVQPTGINSSGQVIGFVGFADLFFGDFRTAPNSPINPATDRLGTLVAGFHNVPTGINDSGQVVGYARGCDLPGCFQYWRSFRTAANSPINSATDDLGTLGIGQTLAHGINSLGQVAGSSLTAGGQTHAFRTAANSAINPATDDLGTLGGSYSQASGVNSSGQVVGSSLTVGGQFHAFRTAANHAINPATDDLGTLGGSYSQAAGVNSSGQVVGSSNTVGDSQVQPFLYRGGVMNNLNNLIPTNSGWTLAQAAAINDLGQIVGYGLINGAISFHAFRLDPTSAGFVSLLQDNIGSLDVPPSLNSVLQAALNALQRGDSTTARNQLSAFQKIVSALRGKMLTDTQADILLNLAAKAIQLL